MNQQDTKEKECEEYWHAVKETAESIVAEFMDNEDGQDQHELLQCLLSESCDQHGYVICDELSIHTLLYSQNACAGFFNGTFAANKHASDAPFPFSTLAEAEANYPSLDESDYSNREFEATIENLKNAAWRLTDDFELPDDWQYQAYDWLSENKSGEVENRDDQGGYPSEEALEAAFHALGFEQTSSAC